MSNNFGNSKNSDFKSVSPVNRIFFAVVLIILGILSRTVFHLGENVEMVTAATLVSGSFLGFSWALIVPLIIMAVSDLLIGNSAIFVFTWSAYLLIGVLGVILFRSKKNVISLLLKAFGAGIFSSLFFYLWTNFGVWFMDSFGMYPDTLAGLMQSYIMGIPFLKYNLIGNLVFVPLFFLVFHLIFSLQLSLDPKKKYSVSK